MFYDYEERARLNEEAQSEGKVVKECYHAARKKASSSSRGFDKRFPSRVQISFRITKVCCLLHLQVEKISTVLWFHLLRKHHFCHQDSMCRHPLLLLQISPVLTTGRCQTSFLRQLLNPQKTLTLKPLGSCQL